MSTSLQCRRKWVNSSLLIFGGLSHDPEGSLAGILFEPMESKARNADRLAKPHLLSDVERLDFRRTNGIGRFYDLEYHVLPVRDHHIANFGIVSRTLCHAHKSSAVRIA